jgi:hypothetical protein
MLACGFSHSFLWGIFAPALVPPGLIAAWVAAWFAIDRLAELIKWLRAERARRRALTRGFQVLRKPVRASRSPIQTRRLTCD